MEAFVNPRSQKKLNTLLQELPQAVLLSGRPGVGLSYIAKNLAGKNLASFIEPLSTKGEIDHETGTISIEIIRRLYEQTRTKQQKKRIIVIDDADRMSAGAQAAFLKLLEEPSTDTHFILTSHTPQALLPTIRSRLQTTLIEPITAEQTEQLIDKLGVSDPKVKLQLEYLATGLPAELCRLAKDSDYFEKRAQIIKDTRDFLTSQTFNRLTIINAYHKDRSDALRLLDSSIALMTRSFQAKPQKELALQLERLLHARDKIESNCNIRLQLMSIVV